MRCLNLLEFQPILNGLYFVVDEVGDLINKVKHFVSWKNLCIHADHIYTDDYLLVTDNGSIRRAYPVHDPVDNMH